MLITTFAQLRFIASLVFGIRFAGWSLDRLVDAMLETQREFGTIGAESMELLGGPELDDETRRVMQERRFRAQAVRAARETRYYAQLFEHLGCDPAKLRFADIATLPLTPKEALREDSDAFVRRSANAYLRAMTTATTGRATSVHFSTYELRTMVALSAISFLYHRQIEPADIIQLNTSSRATLGNIGLAGACARIGAQVYLTGLVEPAHTLALLTQERRVPGKKSRTSIMSTYPSYLGELVETGLRLGYRPSDFGLERIAVGGEVVTAGLKARAQQLFGPVRFDSNFAMTELLPMGGTLCSEGHLHFEPSHGLLEVIDPETGAPAQDGELGTIVATPFPPYRDTTLLLRYDTQDLVRAITGPLQCNLRNLPATSEIQGKLRLSVRHDDGWTTPRDVLEALEAVEEVRLPARCGFWPVWGGVAVEVVARRIDASVRRVIADRLEARGVPLRELYLVEQPEHLRHPFPLRCDLREVAFSHPTTAARSIRLAIELPEIVAGRS